MPIIPVRLPAKVAGPPGVRSWLAVSAVKVSAAVAPSPAPATRRAILAAAGRGRGTRGRAGARRLPRRPTGRVWPGRTAGALMGASLSAESLRLVRASSEQPLSGDHSPGAPQTANQRLRSVSIFRSAPTAPRTCSSSALSRRSLSSGANG